MRRKEIEGQFDAIGDFAEVSKFLETPVKRYSSGMYIRLAFAVAAHLNPEILIVDEVLAVGAGELQRKCLGQLKDVAAPGHPLFLSSHNMTAIGKLCNRSIVLSGGKLAAMADVQTGIELYLN